MSKPLSPMRIVFAFAAGFACFAAILFIPAGRFDWTAGWLYLAIVVVNMVINYVYLHRKNPELIERRMCFGDGTKSWDKVIGWVFNPVFVAVYVVSALDAVRFGWSSMPFWLWLAGFVIFLPGTVLFSWSMGVNPFFERTVRIQTERGHRVIDTGPYRFVRHPGYLGFFGWILSAPLLLGSWWAFVPAFVTILGLVIRTELEDRTLRKELPGYTEYSRRVRFRLVPGVW
ncbi:MAG: isoprenylcysteine carboxylmethyltransferase family protein [Gammaproteobacteria bacterium]|nr:isoprenylcysteine carboxylmethyltransferase family protein [Gammaproteobacteria bacterium]